MAAISVGGAAHSSINPGPEPTSYDRMRHESMRLRQNGLYGIPKFFVNGSAPSRWCGCGCDRLRVWCPNASSK